MLQARRAWRGYLLRDAPASGPVRRMPVLTVARTSNFVRDGLDQMRFGCSEEAAERTGFERPPRFGAGPSAHRPDRMDINDGVA